MPPRTLVIACGALAREVMALVRRHGWSGLEVQCLPAVWHNHPERIPGGVREKIRAWRAGGGGPVFVAYADCGTGGALDAVVEAEGAERIPGAHCYEFYAGGRTFAALHEDEPGTLYLTDYLARNFERLIVRGLGIDRHPELLPIYFGSYRRLAHLAQTRDDALRDAARAAAERLGLEFEYRYTGYGGLEPFLERGAGAADGGDPPGRAVLARRKTPEVRKAPEGWKTPEGRKRTFADAPVRTPARARTRARARRRARARHGESGAGLLPRPRSSPEANPAPEPGASAP